MSPERDAAMMARALRLARPGLGQVWPNPAVGCVIAAADGRIVGRGSTRPGGRPHAETVALAQAGGAARGGTAWVTLEPCAHHGRTPPCADALVAAGLARVVTALTDPDPRVDGGGHAILRAAGIALTESVRAAEAAALNAGFLSRITRGRPMLTLKLALSLDGRIATAAGESRWLTGPAARLRVHALRRSHDAILVGGGTARADRPALTVRGLGPGRPPVRIVATTRPLPDLPPEDAHHGPLWAMAGAPDAMLAEMGARGLTRVLCEGGGDLAAQLLRAGAVDRLVTIHAGVLLGAEGRPGIGPLALAALVDAPRLTLTRAETVGGDLWAEWRPA